MVFDALTLIPVKSNNLHCSKMCWLSLIQLIIIKYWDWSRIFDSAFQNSDQVICMNQLKGDIILTRVLIFDYFQTRRRSTRTCCSSFPVILDFSIKYSLENAGFEAFADNWIRFHGWVEIDIRCRWYSYLLGKRQKCATDRVKNAQYKTPGAAGSIIFDSPMINC